MDKLSRFRLKRLMMAHAGWVKCSFEAQTSKAPSAGSYADGIAIEFKLNGATWMPAVDLVAKGDIWRVGTSLFRVYQFQSRPTQIRITAKEDTDRFSIYKVRLPTRIVIWNESARTHPADTCVGMGTLPISDGAGLQLPHYGDGEP
jgi:hypothetical protein